MILPKQRKMWFYTKIDKYDYTQKLEKYDYPKREKYDFTQKEIIWLFAKIRKIRSYP